MPQRPACLPELAELVSALCEDVITEEQFARLNELLESDPAARSYYAVYIDMHVGLSRRWVGVEPTTSIACGRAPRHPATVDAAAVELDDRGSLAIGRREPDRMACSDPAGRTFGILRRPGGRVGGDDRQRGDAPPGGRCRLGGRQCRAGRRSAVGARVAAAPIRVGRGAVLQRGHGDPRRACRVPSCIGEPGVLPFWPLDRRGPAPGDRVPHRHAASGRGRPGNGLRTGRQAGTGRSPRPQGRSGDPGHANVGSQFEGRRGDLYRARRPHRSDAGPASDDSFPPRNWNGRWPLPGGNSTKRGATRARNSMPRPACWPDSISRRSRSAASGCST